MRKKFKKMALVMIMSAMIISNTGCSNSDSGSSGKNNGEISQNKDNSEDNDGKDNNKEVTQTGFVISEEDKQLYDSLFDVNSTVKISIDIDKEELAKLQQDYDKYERRHSKSPIYRKCNVTFTINGKDYTIDEVGIRMKGNTSRTSFYNESSGVYNIIHYKLSFDQTFDKEEYYGDEAKKWDSDDARNERKKRTFASLSGIDVKWNREGDATYIREKYAFDMYKDMGCLAPLSTVAQCVVNGQNWGAMKVIEQIDETFIERNLDEKDWGGDLYKCTWGSGPADYNDKSSVGIEDEETGQFYSYDLKTNKKNSDFSSMYNFIDTLSDINLNREEVDDILDVDNFAKFCAVSYFLGMPDDMRNNYNNHYIYFRKSDGKAIFIGYDCDLCLGIKSWNPTGSYMTKADPYSREAYGAGNANTNRLIRYGLKKDGLVEKEYTQALKDVAASKWMKFDTFKGMYDAVSSHYSQICMPEINIEKTEKRFGFSVDDTYGSSHTKNGNLPVEDYMRRILDTYNQYVTSDEAQSAAIQSTAQ